MGQDEIVFDEVKFREPRRARRPDRDRRWACAAYEVPAADDLPIFLDRGPADAIERHALRDTSVELGGILLGQECVDDQTGLPFVWITQALEAKHYENTQASFTYTHDAWEEITRERDRLHPDLDIVGWYHTHPDFGIFLSSHDLFIHRNFFDQPLQVALVVDPVRQTRGFFRWKDGGLDQVGGYHLVARREERAALARLVNDLESIPNADAGGGVGGLSPRLEAELIAMLARPHSAAPASAAGQAQAATFFGLIGLVAGAVLMTAVAGSYALLQQFRDQSARLEAMETAVRRSEQVQRSALETLLAKGGGPADPRRFVDSLAEARTLGARETERADREATLAAAAADRIDRLATDLAKATKARAEADAKAAKLAEESDEKAAKIKELDSELSDYLRTDKGRLSARYETAWYAALVGWAAAILAGLGLLARWAGGADAAANAGPASILTEPRKPAGAQKPEPPHQIV